MTTTRTTGAHRGAVRASRGPNSGGGALPGVLAAMIEQYASTLGEHVVRAQLERCRHDLDGVSPASLPEMLYRLAQERLADLAGSAPGPDGVHP